MCQQDSYTVFLTNSNILMLIPQNYYHRYTVIDYLCTSLDISTAILYLKENN